MLPPPIGCNNNLTHVKSRINYLFFVSFCCLLSVFAAIGWSQRFQAPVLEHSATAQPKAVDWYVDATASMQGFVRSDRDTTFAYFTKVLEERLHSMFPASQVTFGLHRFGLVSESFSNVKECWRPGFYAAAKGYEDTDLSVVAKEMQPGHIVVILTDLFQSDSHIEPFRTEMVKRGLGKDFQFALVGFRAEFAGKIYDVPPAKSTVPYKGLRPAYALIFGPAPQLRDLLDALLNESGDLGTGVFATLISSTIGTPAVPFHDLKLSATGGNFFHMAGFDPDDGLVAGGPQPFAKELRLSRSAQEPSIVFQTFVLLRPYEVAPPLPSLSLAHTLRMCSTESPGMLDRLWPSSTKASTSTDPCPPADPAFDILYEDSHVGVTSPAPDKIALSVKLDMGKRGDAVRAVKARSSKLYILHLTVASSQRTGSRPEWISRFTEDGRQKFDGSKTPDLATFVSSMQESVNAVAAPTILDSYLYIDSK